IGAIPVEISYKEHDRVVAAISHLPHLIASSLVNLVKHNDSNKEYMKTLAAGGFKDITRIASSSPEMWEQICMTNNNNISEILDLYIKDLEKVKNELDTKNGQAINHMIAESRDYRVTTYSAILLMNQVPLPLLLQFLLQMVLVLRTSVLFITVNMKKAF
ncbi:prephenate dehydrogenase dimerization domain-containing protein, partial [uncultured Eubacterium sp.]|uniref:prephenate dehydrogenase n=1 Tax=uncultured Eubacterium sp. TaxID=165185 RepID=UPI0026765725